jgi:hypothetical protein
LSEKDESLYENIFRSISRVIYAPSHVVVLDLQRNIMDVAILNPFKSKVISSLIVNDISKAPSINPEGNKKNWNCKNVHDGFPEISVVLYQDIIKDIPSVLYNNLEENSGVVIPVGTLLARDLNIEYSIVAIRVTAAPLCVGVIGWITVDPPSICTGIICITSFCTINKVRARGILSTENFTAAKSITTCLLLGNQISCCRFTGFIESICQNILHQQW